MEKLSIDKLLSHPMEPLAIIDCESLNIIQCNENFKNKFLFNYSCPTQKDFFETLSIKVSRKVKDGIIDSIRKNRIFIDTEITERYHIFINSVVVDEREYGILGINDKKEFNVYDQYKKLFDKNLAGVYRIDLEGNILSCNQAFAQIFGYNSSSDMLKMNANELYHNSKAREKYLHQLRENILIKNYEIEIVRKDGSIGFCIENSYLENLSNGNQIISGTIIDYSEKKQLERDLHERQYWFKSLANVSTEGVLFVTNGEIVIANNVVAHIFGYGTGNDIIGLKLSDIIRKDELARIQKRVQITKFNKTDIRLNIGDKLVYIEISGSKIRYKGKPTIAYIITDISERRKTELALERTVFRLKNLLENLPNGVIIVTDTLVKYLNNEAYILLGAEEEDEVYGTPFLHFVDEPFRDRVADIFNEIIEGFEGHYLEIKITSLTGEERDVGIKPVITVYDGKPSIQITLTDLIDKRRLVDEQARSQLIDGLNSVLKQEIAEHKKTQEQLVLQQHETSEQKAKLEAIFNSTENILMWTVDKKGFLRNLNSNFKNWCNEVSGKNIKVGSNIISYMSACVDPDFDQGQMKAFDFAFQEKPQQLEVPLRDKHGDTLWIELFLNPIYVDNGFKELSCLAYDISERKEYEKSIRHTLKEKEVLLKEVHHRVKNNLQIIASMLNLQTAYVEDENTLEVLKDSQQRINSISSVHEIIYRNSDFSSIDFSEYIRTIVHNLIQNYINPEVDFELILDLAPVEIDIDQSIPCGLIINELVSNVMKYAFKGREKGKLWISVSEDGSNQVELRIKDDGVGLPKKEETKRQGSLGLTLVSAFTEQLNGTLITKSHNGTSHTLTFIKK